jgi:hypothetical protein
MKPLRGVGALAAVGACLLAIPSESGAHCVPGWTHMNGYGWWQITGSGASYPCDGSWDSGCVFVGTVQASQSEFYCTQWVYGNCMCWRMDFTYNCDGC